MRMQVGTELADGRYILRERLKRTGMAEVWVAEQRGMHGFSKSVIVKMIHPDLSEQHEARTRFFDEARFASKIRHPNVVEIYDFGEENGIFYLVMEYIQGYDLEALVEKCKETGSKIPIPFICRLMADSAKGLQVIHALRDDRGQPVELVHRDISPQNLVVAASGVIKIIDFGVVKAKEKSSRTRTGVIVGKLQYMSPEQLSSEELDARSDVFSLGLVLFELLTLEPRFRGTNLLEIFYEALNEPMPDVAGKRGDCPPDIVECVKKSLAQKKADRFQSAQDMQRSLETHLIQQGIAVTESDIAGYLAQVFQTGRSISYGETDSLTSGDSTMRSPATQSPRAVGPAMMGSQGPSHTISAQPPSASDEDDPEMHRIRQALGPAANSSVGGGHTFDSRSEGGHTFDSRSMGRPMGNPMKNQRPPQAPPISQQPMIMSAPAPSSSYGGGSPFAQMEPSYQPIAGLPSNMGGGEATVVLDTDQLNEVNEATVVLQVPSSDVLQAVASMVPPTPSGLPSSAITSFGNEPTNDLSGMAPSQTSVNTPPPAPYGKINPMEFVASQQTMIGAYPSKPKKNLLWLWILIGAVAFGGGLLVVYLMVG
ncbi:MAG: protein kinase [Myxococcales bacterium]|nr:protein kinase [Myxococcales bacterium]MCB9644099.1 protein kinase [Myxococcales bacterium]